MSKLRFDLAKQGLHCILKPYQAEVMHFLWQTQKPQDSRAVHQHIKTAGVPGAKSRASIINFLNHMVQEGFLDYKEKSTKGGYKRIYRLNSTSIDEEVFKVHVANRFQLGLLQFKQIETVEDEHA